MPAVECSLPWWVLAISSPSDLACSETVIGAQAMLLVLTEPHHRQGSGRPIRARTGCKGMAHHPASLKGTICCTHS